MRREEARGRKKEILPEFERLNTIYSIAKTLILNAEYELIEILMSDECFLDTFAILECKLLHYGSRK